MRSARRARLAPPPVVSAVALLVALGGLAGCRSGSALHRRYDNFRAYYNTYYNAEQSLEEGERALLNVDTPVDRARLVELFPTGAETAGRTPVFDAAIEKSAELLRRRPGSRWADDALLVIGKAYFYERNFVGAEQKFRETMAAAELVSDRELADEARFWLGRTMAAADRYDEGVLVLREALERPDGDRYWQARMHLALGDLYARAGRWDASTVALRDGLAGVSDADLGARAALLLGQVEEAAGRYDAAAAAYQDALDRQPAYEIAFVAELNRGLVLGLDAGRPADGLAALRAMGSDDKHYARRAEVALAQARVLAAAGTADEAGVRFREVLYDPALAGQNVRGEAHYRLAEFYRDALGDYVTAAAHFDTAATAITAVPSVAERPSRAAIVGARDVASTFETVARTSRRIAAVDSLLALGALDDDAFAARIAEIESVRRAEWVEQRRELDAQRTAQDFGGQAAVVPSFGNDPRGGQADDGSEGRGVSTTGTGGSPGAAGASDAANGFLGYRDPRTVQAGLLSFQRIYGDRPLVPNWRRRSAVQGGSVASGVGLGQTAEDFVPGLNGLAGPPPLDLSGVPRTAVAQAVLVTERASLRYELANTFFLSLGRADRAGVLYRQILDETPEAPVAARARYALAELEAGEGRTDAAAPLYRDVAAADSVGALGLAARARLEGREPVAAAPVLDDQTEADYAAARRLWDDGDPFGAAVALVALGSADPDSDGAPRAFLAAALAYADWAQADSSALLAPLPPELVPPALADVAPPPVDASGPAPALPGATTFDEPTGQPRDPEPDRQVPRPAVEPGSLDAPVPVGADSLSENLPSPDSLQQVRAETPDESTAMEPGTAADVAADSSEGRTDAGLGLTDSADTAAAPGFTLRDFLAALAVRYPGTPYARRAQAMADALPGADGTPERTAGPEDAVAFDGFSGSALINPALGGVTWQLGPFATRAETEERLATARRAGARAFAATDDVSFYVLIGQFEDAATATVVAETIDPEVLAGATVVPVSDLAILAPEDVPPDPSQEVTPRDGTSTTDQ